MKKALIVIAPHDFQDHEYYPVREALEDAYIDLTVASTTAGTATGKYGAVESVDIAFADAQADDYNAIIIIGGPGAETLVGNADLYRLIREFHAQGKLLAAICFSGALLADAGVIADKKITVHEAGFALANGKCAAIIPTPVVADGDCITAKDPAAATEFGAAIIAYLSTH